MPKTTETPDVAEVVNEAITNLEIDAQLDATVMRNIFLTVLAANAITLVAAFGTKVVLVHQLKKMIGPDKKKDKDAA
jgi:hypothetical protein